MEEKPVVWLHGEVKTPPFTDAGRAEAGFQLGQLQQGIQLGMPKSRPMPNIGPSCHELRVRDEGHNWRLMYHVDADAVVVLDVFPKTTQKTRKQVFDNCQRRLARYLLATAAAKLEGK